jgi:acetylglutamate kinase
VREATEKAGVLIEALPYIKSFHKKFVVVKFGGSAMLEEAVLRAVLTDIVFMEQVGMWPVVVHGGGPRITELMRERGMEPEFRDGRRVTTPDVLAVVCEVLIDEISRRVCSIVEEMGGRGVALNGRDSAFLKGEPIDERLGLVGRVTGVDRQLCARLADGGVIPVVAPVARGSDSQLYNVNADDAASAIASQLRAEKLVFLSDVPGVLRDPGDESSLISSIPADETAKMAAEGRITGGMIPKVQSCLRAIEGGVRKTHIVSGLVKHALLLEIFTDKGIGTEIVGGVK